MPAYLVVDDSSSIRLSVAAALRAAREGAPVDVLEAATGGEAMGHFMERDFDVVFLDMVLGDGGSGLDLLRAMLAARPEARIVLMTGLDREHADVVEAISLGAFGHLRKPVRMADVRDVLHEVEVESGRAGRIA